MRLQSRSKRPRARASLGRVFDVIRETWRLADDPLDAPHSREPIATLRSASEAADLARQAAEAFPRHGFHKPSSGWWAVEDGCLHRFRVRPRVRKSAVAALAVSGLAGLAALIVIRRGRGR